MDYENLVEAAKDLFGKLVSVRQAYAAWFALPETERVEFSKDPKVAPTTDWPQIKEVGNAAVAACENVKRCMVDFCRQENIVPATNSAGNGLATKSSGYYVTLNEKEEVRHGCVSIHRYLALNFICESDDNEKQWLNVGVGYQVKSSSKVEELGSEEAAFYKSHQQNQKILRTFFDSYEGRLAKGSHDGDLVAFVSIPRSGLSADLLSSCIGKMLSKLRLENSWLLENKKNGMTFQEYLMKKEVKELVLNNHQVILRGAPGTGKTYVAKQVAEEIAGEKGKVKSVQFHPGYTYADFVVGMRPVMMDEKGQIIGADGTVVDEKGAPIEDAKKADGKLSVSFVWKDGEFKRFADEAREKLVAASSADKVPKYVFLIDEINRADLSRVFGELFSLIEEEYRYHKGDPEGKNEVALPSGAKFVIPENLYVIGTMNDIDRSVESMDFALRRRFAWREVRVNDTKDAIFAGIPEITKELQKAMDRLNARLVDDEEFFKNGKGKLVDEFKINRRVVKVGLTSAHQIGAAIIKNIVKYKNDPNAIAKLWANHIENILQEYMRGKKDGADIVRALRKEFVPSNQLEYFNDKKEVLEEESTPLEGEAT